MCTRVWAEVLAGRLVQAKPGMLCSWQQPPPRFAHHLPRSLDTCDCHEVLPDSATAAGLALRGPHLGMRSTPSPHSTYASGLITLFRFCPDVTGNASGSLTGFCTAARPLARLPLWRGRTSGRPAGSC